MPVVKVSPKTDRNQLSHHLSLSDGTQTLGLIFAGDANVLQRNPMTEPPRQFSEMQKDWTSGRGRRKFRDDPSGFADSLHAWTMTGNKLFPNPQWQFSKGTRSSDTTELGSVTFKPLYGTTLAIAQTFTASATYSADKAVLLIRRVGSPGTLTFILAANNATPNPDEPGTVLQTVTKTVSDITDYVSVYETFDWASTQALTSGTAYWIYIYGATTDTSMNHWEVACNTSGTGALKSASGTSPTWTANSPDFSMYYNVFDADVDRFLYFWQMQETQYCIAVNADNSAPKIYINGDMGRCTSSTSTTLTDSNSGVTSGWATDEWAGSWVRIVEGTGVGQARQISSNTSTQLTVTPAWGTSPSTDSKYTIYKSRKWTEITGHGLTVAPTGRPLAANKTTIFFQGASTAMRRMRQDVTNANNHGFTAMTTTDTGLPIYFDFGETHTTKAHGPRLWCTKAETTALYNVVIGGWADQFVMTATKNTAIGQTDARVTGLYSIGENLHVGKEDSLWWVDEGTVRKYTVPIRDVRHPRNCTAVTEVGENIYFNYGGSLGRLTNKTQFSDLLNFRSGYEGLPADRRGHVSAILPVMGWLFFAVDGGASNYSSVYAWNEMGIHEVWRAWKVGVRIRDIFYQNNVDTNGRLWIDAGGNPVYVDFPFNATNPRLDSGFRYHHELVMIPGEIDIEKEDFYKLFHEVRLMSENLSPGSRWVELDYQINENVGTNTWQRYGEFVQSPADTRIMDLGEVFKVRFRFRAYSNSNATPPVITSYDVRGSISDPPKYMWIGSFRVGGNPPKTLTGQRDFSASKVVKMLTDWHNKRTKLQMNAARDLDDDKIVTISLPADVADYINPGEWGGRVTLKIEEA